MKIGKVDGGGPGGASGAESSKEGLLEGIPVVTVNATAFEGVKPTEIVPTESFEHEGHGLVGGPGHCSAVNWSLTLHEYRGN